MVLSFFLNFSKELDEMSWIKGPRQLLTLGMFKITKDDRMSIVPPVSALLALYKQLSMVYLSTPKEKGRFY